MKATTLKDIAGELGISVMTVSKALKDHPDISKARKKEVRETAARLNYVPNAVAQSLRGQQSKLIGAIFTDASNPYYSAILKGIDDILFPKGFCSVVNSTMEDPNKEAHCIEQLISVNVAGVILTPTFYSDKTVQELKKHQIPYVLINRYIDSHKDNYVVADDYSAGYMAACHLLKSKNLRTFALWLSQKELIAKERLSGVKSAFKEQGMTIEEKDIIDSCIGADEGYREMKKILTDTAPPFSVICFNDFIALGAMKAIRESGYFIPSDISIIGIDNVEFLDYVGLTSINIPKREIGMRASELLLSLMKSEREGVSATEQHIVLNTSLAERGSVFITE